MIDCGDGCGGCDDCGNCDGCVIGCGGDTGSCGGGCDGKEERLWCLYDGGGDDSCWGGCGGCGGKEGRWMVRKDGWSWCLDGKEEDAAAFVLSTRRGSVPFPGKCGYQKVLSRCGNFGFLVEVPTTIPDSMILSCWQSSFG